MAGEIGNELVEKGSFLLFGVEFRLVIWGDFDSFWSGR